MSYARANRDPATAKGADSRERILSAAQALFQERGYAGLSISALCERAGIAPTSIYWHFGDKAGLLRAIVERASGGHVAQIRKAVAQVSGSQKKQLDVVVGKVRDLVTKQPLGSLSFVAMLAEGGPVTDELRIVMRDARRRELDAIAADFESVLGPGQGRSAALTALAFANYAALTYRVTRDVKDVDEILDAMREEIERRLVRRTPQGPRRRKRREKG
jgi:AcrR family transcriptional regulator